MQFVLLFCALILRIKYVFWDRDVSTDVFLKMKNCGMPPQRSKHQTRVLQQGKVFLTCLFVWASDELIGTGTDWLLLREGSNFSVILWLIIALKYVTVPTPSEVFDRKLWCVFTQAGRQTDSYLAPTPWEVTQLLLTVFATVCSKLPWNTVFLKRWHCRSPVITACLLETVRAFYENMCSCGNWRPDRLLERILLYIHDT